MVPFYDSGDGVRIFQADYRDVIAARVIGTVDHVVTDPPYNVRQDNITIEGRGDFRRDFGSWDENWMAGPFLIEIASVVRPGGSLLSFTSDRLLSQFRESPAWKPRGTIVWIKKNFAPVPRPGYAQATEFIVWLQKPGAAATWNGDGYTANVLTYTTCCGDERDDHPTQKPEALLLDLIARHTNAGDTIIDPFMGTGTTLAAAKRLGRKAIGIDVSAKYCDIAARRVAQGTLFQDVV
jgi:DNA modification methylase